MEQATHENWESLREDYYKFLRFEKNLSLNTIEAYMRDVGQFRTFVEEEFAIMPAEVAAPHIEAFMAHLYDRGAGKNSQARILSGIRSFFTWLVITERIAELPTEFVDGPKTGRKLPDVLTVGEIDALLTSIDVSEPLGHRNRAIIETLYSCGLRVSELTALRLSDLFFDEGMIRVTGKGNKQRLIPVSQAAQRNIKLYLDRRKKMPVHPASEDILFLNQRGDQLTRVMVFTLIRQAAGRAGITKSISPHTFRHSFATHLLEGGASIRQVQEMLGHESIDTTEIYTHLNITGLRKSIESHHPLNKGQRIIK